MKELTEKEKAQKYDEAVSKLRLFMAQGVDPLITRADVQDFFPELKESEDEKMRAMAIKAVYAPDAQSCIKSWGINPDDVIAWLKKQGKTSPILSNSSNIGKVEQKPVISYDAIREGISRFGITQYQIDNWLKKYVDVEKQGEQKPDGWSEEDEEMFDAIIADIQFTQKAHNHEVNQVVYEREIDWLKSIKERCTWKPTDKQMKQLGWIAEQNKDNMIGKELMSLYQDLLKLKE